MRFLQLAIGAVLGVCGPLHAALAQQDWSVERLIGNVTDSTSFAMQIDGKELPSSLKFAHGPSLSLYPRWKVGEPLRLRVTSVRQSFEDVADWTVRFRDAKGLGMEPELPVEKVEQQFLLLSSIGQSELQPLGPFLFIPHPGGKGASVSPFAQWSVVRGEEAGAPYDEIGWLTFTPDGKQLAYSGRRGQEWSLWVNGKDRGRYARVESFVFAPRGPRFAAGVQDGDGARMVDEAGKKGKIYASLDWPVFSPDGQVVAFGAQEETSWFMVVGDKAGAGFERVGRPVFRPDGKEVAYTAERAGVPLLVRGEQIVEGYERASWPVYSPDGKQFAFVARKGGRSFVVLNGVEQTKADETEWPVFSPDGKVLAYRVRYETTWSLVVNGEREARFSWVGRPMFSSSGHVLAFPAKVDQKWVVVLEKQVSPAFDWVGHLRIDADGHALGFAALAGNSLWWKRLRTPSPGSDRGK